MEKTMEDACIQVISPNRTYIPTSNQQHYNLVVKVSRNKKKTNKQKNQQNLMILNVMKKD